MDNFLCVTISVGAVGRSRTDMELSPRHFECRVSASSTTWPCFIECVGTELNRQSPKAGGLRPLELANAQPTRLNSYRSVKSVPEGI